MPKKTPEPEQAPKADNYAKINMPAAFLTPHEFQAKDGVSLAGEARDMETGKDALAGDDPAKSTKSRTGQDIAQ